MREHQVTPVAFFRLSGSERGAHRLPKVRIIRRKGDFQRVYHSGRSYANRYLVLYVFREEGVGVVVQLRHLQGAVEDQPVDHIRHLAEAAAEYLQHSTLNAQRSTLRVAFGYVTCPDHSLKRIVFDLLDAERQLNITLTDHYSIQPSTAICGLFICHPEAHYFPVGRIGEDQLADYCQRRGISVTEGEQLLSKYIAKQS